MTARNTLLAMLSDAIQWQEGYLDAVVGTEYEEQARTTLKEYRAYLKRRTGSSKSALETRVEKSLEGAVLMDISEIRKLGAASKA